MIHSKILQGLTVVALAALALQACGAKPTEPPTIAPAGKSVTHDGFECPEPEPRMDVSSAELNLYVWTEYIPAEMQECFELVYGIKVNREEYSSNEEMYARLAVGGTAYDLVQPSDYIIPAMIRDGLLGVLDKMSLPNLKHIDANYMNFEFDPGNKYTIPYQAGTDALVVNTDKVENPPKSWADLWNPEYAGRMVFTDDARVVIGMTLLTLGYDINSTDPAQLDQARQKLMELIPNVKLFDSDSPSVILIPGDVDLGITWTGEAFTAHAANPAIIYVYPTEGATLWQDNWAMPTRAPHPDAAYAWLNYTMQGNVFWLMLRDFPYTNPNTAALEYARDNQPELYRAYIQSPITNTPPEEIRKGHRIADVGDAAQVYEQIWAELKGE